MKYMGDYADDSTVRIFFTTNDGSGGAVAPSTAFEAADIVIYKNNSATQKATTNGITMTSPFDTVTGLHLVEIDCSNDTGDAGFWATGNDYSVVLSPDETVDSQSVVAALAQFSIENRVVSAVSGNVAGIAGTINTLDALDTAQDSQHSTTQSAISALNNFDPALDTVANVTTVGSVSGPVGSISGITFPTGFSSLTVSAVADGVWDEAQAGHTTVGTFGYYLDDQISGISGGGGGTDWTATERNQIRYRLGVDGTTAAPSVNSPDLATQASVDTIDTVVDSILVDTGTTLPAQISGIETKVDTVDANVDAVLVDTGTTIPGTIATVDANVDAILVDTGTTLPATLATIEGKVDTVDTVADAIKVDTAAILADTGTDGVVISTAQAQAIADEVLKRSVAGVETTAAEHTLATIVLAILESERSATSWTIYESDGVTVHASKGLTTDSNLQPVKKVT